MSNGDYQPLQGEFNTEAEGGYSTDDYALGMVIFGMSVGVLCRLYLTHLLQMPHTVLKLLIGVLLGMLARVNGLGIFGAMLLKWVNIDPEVLLLVFIPVLIFESAFNTDVHVFQREFWQVVTLAGPGTVIASVFTALILQFWLPYGWSWYIGMTLGAVLSATDPPSIVALLRDQLSVSQRLAARIEGESLLNDGVAVVIFVIFKDALLGGKDSQASHIAATAARLALGGPLLGLAVGIVGSFVLGRILDDAFSEITITIVLCYSAFLLAEATAIQVSGILSVVTLGLFLSYHARGRISNRAGDGMVVAWSMLSYVSVTMVFVTTGLVIGNEVLFANAIDAAAWAYVLVIYLGVHLARVAVVAICSPVLIAKGTRRGVDLRQAAVLAFGGLRGAIGLTLALILYRQQSLDQDTRDLAFFFTWGVTALTLIIDGALAKPLLSRLGLDRSVGSETEVFTRACWAMEARLQHAVDLIKGDRFLGDAHWELVWRYLPVLTAKTYWHRIRQGNIVLSDVEEQDLRRMADEQDEAEWSAAMSAGFSRGRRLQYDIGTALHKAIHWVIEHVMPGKGAAGGTNYTHLPQRLRHQWYRYHQQFHGGAADVTSQIEQARMNALPQMSLRIDAWAGAEEADGADHLQALLGAAALDSGSSAPFALDGAAPFDQGGEGGLRPARSDDTARLSSPRSLASPPFSRPQDRGSPPLPPKSGGAPLPKGGQHSSAPTLGEPPHPGAVGGGAKGMLSMYPDLAALAVGGAQGRALAEEIALLRGTREAAVQGVRSAEERLYERERALELATAADGDDSGGESASAPQHRGLGWGGSETAVRTATAPLSSRIRSMSLSRSKGAAAAAAVHADAASNGGTSQHSAALSEDEHHAVNGNGHEDMSQGSLNMKDAMAEARVRFLSAVKANYQERLHQGWLSASGARVLRENIDAQLENTEASLREWSVLARSFAMPAARLAPLRRLPLAKRLVDPFIYGRLAFIFELASNFIAAHEDVDILQIIKEGPVAYQLAFEKTKQLREARDTLVAQLPVFPELARSLKTQVAARYILVQHRGMVEESYRHGHINDREYARLLHSNNVSRVKLDYHPHTDHIPDRSQLLKGVPFLRFLTDADRETVIRNSAAVVEEFRGSHITLMRERSADVTGHKRSGWYVVVRGSVRQVTKSFVMGSGRHANSTGSPYLGPLVSSEEVLPINCVINGDTIGRHGEVPQMVRKERLLHAGTVFGLDDQLLEIPYHSTYTTASFAHLFFFDKAQILAMAEDMPELNRGLWWSLAVSVMRHHRGFRRMTLKDVYQVMTSAEFVDVRQHLAHANGQARGLAEVGRYASGSAASLSKMRRSSVDSSLHRASGILRSLATKGGDHPSQGEMKGDALNGGGTVMTYEPLSGGQILILRGRMLARPGTLLFPPLPEKTGVAIIRDVEGPIQFLDGTVFFYLPRVLLARTSSPRQMLMHSIQKIAEEGGATHVLGRSGTARRRRGRSVSISKAPPTSSVMPGVPLDAHSMLPLPMEGSSLAGLAPDDLQAITPSAEEARRMRNARDAGLAAKASGLWEWAIATDEEHPLGLDQEARSAHAATLPLPLPRGSLAGLSKRRFDNAASLTAERVGRDGSGASASRDQPRSERQRSWEAWAKPSTTTADSNFKGALQQQRISARRRVTSDVDHDDDDETDELPNEGVPFFRLGSDASDASSHAALPPPPPQPSPQQYGMLSESVAYGTPYNSLVGEVAMAEEMGEGGEGGQRIQELYVAAYESTPPEGSAAEPWRNPLSASQQPPPSATWAQSVDVEAKDDEDPDDPDENFF